MSTRSFQTVNPASGQTIATYQYANTRDITAALTASANAQSEWQSVSLPERARILRAAANILRQNKDEYARLMTTEMGKPLLDAQSEIEKCAMTCDYYAEEAPRALSAKDIRNERMKGRVYYEPLGTVLAIMPWNFPFWQVFRFAAPNLMAGNTGLLKHSHNVAGCGAAIADVFRKAGAPAHVFSHIHLQSEDVEKVLADERIVAVTLTGSTRAGKSVAEIAGRYLKKGVYELGGSDAYVILADADIGLAAKVCAEARLINSGQSCIAAKRFLVVRAVLKDFIAAFTRELESYPVGDPMHPLTKVGPMAREDLREGLAQQVASSIKKGAILNFQSEADQKSGFYYPVTLLTNVQPGMPAFDEELFGPVAAVTPCADDEEALTLANKSVYGLGSAIFTADTERGIELAAHRLMAGACAVNTSVTSDPDFPFGGIKQSGYGRELGEAALREFVNIKSVLIG